MSWVEKVKKVRLNIIWRINRLRPIQNNKILMWADGFKHFGCSPKYIALYLLKQYPGKYDIVWVFDQNIDIPSDMPKSIRVVRYFSLEYLREISTAKVIICNSRTGEAHYFKKRNGQLYVQTWHSSLRLKKIEGDAIDTLGQKYVKNAMEDSKKIDVLLSGCEFSTHVFQHAFWYDGEILKSGTPRCDILIQGSHEIRTKVYQYYNIPSNKKLLLYAPTFRNDKKAHLLGMKFNILLDTLHRTTGVEWVVACRLHPNINEKLSDENCLSMTEYPDMQELIVASDVLVTDYSSCMFDMAIAGKPCFLYTPDLEQYLKDERGMYFDIRKLPFPLATTMAELSNNLSVFDSSQYKNNITRFMESIGSYEDGKASQRVVEYMIKKMRKVD